MLLFSGLYYPLYYLTHIVTLPKLADVPNKNPHHSHLLTLTLRKHTLQWGG